MAKNWYKHYLERIALKNQTAPVVEKKTTKKSTKKTEAPKVVEEPVVTEAAPAADVFAGLDMDSLIGKPLAD